MSPKVSDRVQGVVLAGGLSTRMGRDKARIRLDGEFLYVRAARCLIEVGCDRVVVVARSDLETHADISDFWRDLHGGQGPLDGLLTALTNSTAPMVSVLAVDLPGVTGEVLRRTREALAENLDLDAVVLRGGKGRQALAASWRRVPTLERIQPLFASGERSLHRILESLVVQDVIVGDEVLVNVNTPEELAALRSE